MKQAFVVVRSIPAEDGCYDHKIHSVHAEGHLADDVKARLVKQIEAAESRQAAYSKALTAGLQTPEIAAKTQEDGQDYFSAVASHVGYDRAKDAWLCGQQITIEVHIYNEG